MEKGDEIEVGIDHKTSDGRGVCLSEDKIIIISGVSEDDETIKAEVTKISEETRFDKKTSRTSEKKKEENAEDASTYELDEEDYEED